MIEKAIRKEFEGWLLAWVDGNMVSTKDYRKGILDALQEMAVLHTKDDDLAREIEASKEKWCPVDGGEA